jgi:pimeloyl-ACP methyl ester carboxylesterase
VAAALRRGNVAPKGDVGVLASGFASLHDGGSRQAFLHTVRSVIDTGGQRVSANDRLHLAAVLPTMILWGERDSIIPPRHGLAAHEAMPGSRLELFPDAGHLPHHQDPERFAQLLADFCDTTEPARLTADHWRP